MSTKKIHIVSFDVPFPADYGGVIDVFYKLKALHLQGVEITLHCFEYGRKPVKELEQFCKQVYYYKRQMRFFNLLKPTPFIVNTRADEQLMHNILQDDAPILFEGLHSCFFLNDKRLANRKRIVRTHNIEHDYYNGLADAETSFFQKIYLRLEARKLKRFESVLQHATAIAAISKNDEVHFKQTNNNTEIVSAFHQNENIEIKEGRGEYVLYHGNLGVSENYNAAIFLCETVFSKLNISFVIAGNNAPEILKATVKKYPTIQLKENINTESIIDLIRNAQINILITQQATGIKLKLLAALFNGRHCVVNPEMVTNTGLESFCLIGENEVELQTIIHEYYSKPFTTSDIEKRKPLENSRFSNGYNVQKLIKLF